MNSTKSRRIAVLLAWITALAASGQEPVFHTWSMDQGRLEISVGASDAPLAVGSLQKPFVARAWAQAHPEAASPRFLCKGGRACWLKRGHGELGLTTALARSCNAYFRLLAEATPTKLLADTFVEAGFAPAPSNADQAIGLAAPGLLRIRPSRLLEAYRELLRDPWPLGEALRREVLAGLREGVRIGTAGGLATWGIWAKTGTVPLDEQHTVGFALAMDEGGLAMLARLQPGTGAQAATALATPLAAHRPGTPVSKPAGDIVSVRLFDLLPAVGFTVRNASSQPIPDGRGFLGPGASRPLRPGDRVGPGTLELRAEGRGLRRRFQGALQVTSGRLLATLTRRAYVEGVLAAELPDGDRPLRQELGAAVLRFLARGRRHVDADVCDSTHCAWFVGQGPRLDWTNPAQAKENEGAIETLGEMDWARIQAWAASPGPAFWTAHCGGSPLSTQRVWGWGEASAPPCPRHLGSVATWVRTLNRRELEQVFGTDIETLAVVPPPGVWGLTVLRKGEGKTYGYDEAHRRIAAVKGWDALPSPPSRVELTGDGARFSGEGSGHRVGLCLAK